MKTLQSIFITLALSFLILSSCDKLPPKPSNMSFTLTIPGGTVQLSGNPILIQASTTTTGYDIHRLLLKITCTNSVIPGGPWTDEIPVDSSHNATFDIHAIVDVDFDLEFSESLTEEIVSHTLNSALITVQIGEMYIDASGDLVEAWGEATGDSADLTILKGGLSKLEQGMLNDASSSFYDSYVVGKKFLTKLGPFWIQTIHVTAVSDWVKLWFTFATGSTATPRITAYFTDGTNYYEELPSFTPDAGVMYELNAHNWAGAVQTSEAKTIEKYLINLGGSEWFAVEIDGDYFESHNEFLFANSLSAIEVLHCTGALTENPETSGETYTKPQASDHGLKDATIVSAPKSINSKYKINTGFKTLHERRWILDMLRSDEIYWKTDAIFNYASGTKYLPIVITPASYNIDVSTEDLMSIEFEFQIAHTDKYL